MIHAPRGDGTRASPKVRSDRHKRGTSGRKGWIVEREKPGESGKRETRGVGQAA